MKQSQTHPSDMQDHIHVRYRYPTAVTNNEAVEMAAADKNERTYVRKGNVRRKADIEATGRQHQEHY